MRKDLEVIVLPKRKKRTQMAIELLQEKIRKERAAELQCLGTDQTCYIHVWFFTLLVALDTSGFC